MQVVNSAWFVSIYCFLTFINTVIIIIIIEKCMAVDFRATFYIFIFCRNNNNNNNNNNNFNN